MKKTLPLIVCVLCFALLAAGVTPAQTQAPVPPDAATAAPAAAADIPFGRTSITFTEDFDAKPWWQSQTRVDPAGGGHVVYFTNEYVYYAYCPNTCHLAASWKKAAIAPGGEYDSLTIPSLALDSAGRPRVVWYPYTDTFDTYDTYAYAECNSNCTLPASWKSTRVVVNDMYSSDYPHSAHYFAVDGNGRPRFIVPYYDGLIYVYCDAACTVKANWHYAKIDLPHGLEGMQLVLSGSGQPRVVGVGDLDLNYVQCNQNCAQPASWTMVKIADDVINSLSIPSYALRLDGQGRPRVAYYKSRSTNDKTIFYAWSNANFTSAASWTTDPLPDMGAATDRTLELLIDSGGSPHIIFADDNFDLMYLRCTASCNTLNSVWWLQSIETGEDLEVSDPIEPGGGAWANTWWIEGHASAALDARGRLSVSYFVRNVDFIDTSADPRAWAIRFATAPGVGPKTYQNPVYLPLLRK